MFEMNTYNLFNIHDWLLLVPLNIPIRNLHLISYHPAQEESLVPLILLRRPEMESLRIFSRIIIQHPIFNDNFTRLRQLHLHHIIFHNSPFEITTIVSLETLHIVHCLGIEADFYYHIPCTTVMPSMTNLLLTCNIHNLTLQNVLHRSTCFCPQNCLISSIVWDGELN